MKIQMRSAKRLLGSIVFAFVLVWVACLLQNTLKAMVEQQRFSQYGEWQFAVYDNSLGTLSALEKHVGIEKRGKMTPLGNVVDGNERVVARLGYVDDAAVGLGHITLAEGTLPAKPNQIAMEMSTLVALGYSFDVDQVIDVPVIYTDAFGKVQHHSYQFLLTGILNTYSVAWNGAGDGPVNAIVNNDFIIADAPTDSYILLCSGQYKSINNAQELSVLLSKNGTLVLNTHAYPVNDNSLVSLVERNLVSVLGVLLSFVLLVCDIYSWVWAETENICIYKDLGATVRQIRNRMVKIFSFSSLLSFFIAFPLGLAVSALLCVIFGKIRGQIISISLSENAVIGGSACVVSIYFAGLLFLLTRVIKVCKRSLTIVEKSQKDRTVTVQSDEPISIWKFAKIHARSDRKLYLSRNTTAIVFCLLSFSIFFADTSKLISYKQNQIVLPEAYYWSSPDLRTGFNSSEVDELSQTEKISHVYAYSVCTSTLGTIQQQDQVMTWNNIVDSSYPLAANSQISGVRLVGISQVALYRNLVSVADSNSGTDASFASGGVILYLPGFRDNTLKIGDKVTISTMYGDYSAPVAGIITKSVSFFDKQTQVLACNQMPGDAIISKDCLDKFVGFKTEYNSVSAWINDSNVTQNTSSEEVTDKLVSRIPTTGSLEFTNFREEKSAAKQALVSFLLLTGFILAVVFILFGVTTYYNHSVCQGKERTYLLTLQSIGTSRRRLRAFAVAQTSVISIFLPLAMAVVCASLWCVSCLRHYIGSNAAIEALRLLDSIWIRFFPWKEYVIFVVLVIAVPLAVLLLQMRKDHIVTKM